MANIFNTARTSIKEAGPFLYDLGHAGTGIVAFALGGLGANYLVEDNLPSPVRAAVIAGVGFITCMKAVRFLGEDN